MDVRRNRVVEEKETRKDDRKENMYCITTENYTNQQVLRCWPIQHFCVENICIKACATVNRLLTIVTRLLDIKYSSVINIFLIKSLMMLLKSDGANTFGLRQILTTSV